MRGPRVRAGGASSPLEFAGGFDVALASLAGIVSGAVSSPFADVEAGGRFRPGRLRGRMFSPST